MTGAMFSGSTTSTTAACRAFSIAAARILFVVTINNKISDPIVQTSTARNGKRETPAELFDGRRLMEKVHHGDTESAEKAKKK